MTLCNISLSDENVEMTILLAFFPRKADRNIVTNYGRDRNLLNTEKKRRAISDLVHLKNIASK